jgi:hypothetical protein
MRTGAGVALGTTGELVPARYAARPMKVRVNRDSVCAGDDVDAHDLVLDLPDAETLAALVVLRSLLDFVGKVIQKPCEPEGVMGRFWP